MFTVSFIAARFPIGFGTNGGDVNSATIVPETFILVASTFLFELPAELQLVIIALLSPITVATFSIDKIVFLYILIVF
jgi:hypothetical protein